VYQLRVVVAGVSPLIWRRLLVPAPPGALAGALHAKATTASLRAHLISVPARIATSGRRPTLHLPRNWPWETGW